MTELHGHSAFLRDRKIAPIVEWVGVFAIVSGVALRITSDASPRSERVIFCVQLIGAGCAAVLLAHALPRHSKAAPTINRPGSGEVIAWAILPPLVGAGYLPVLGLLRLGRVLRHEWELFFLLLGLLFAWRWVGWEHRSRSKVLTLGAEFAIVSGFFAWWIIEGAFILTLLWSIPFR